MKSNNAIPRLKIIHWYVFKELLAPFLTSIVTFSVFMLMGRMLKLSDLLVNRGLHILDLIRLIIYIFLPFLVYIIPMALLLAILLALGRLSADNEIIAMKTSGVSLYQIVIPLVLFATLAFLLTISLTLYAYPWGFRSLRNLAFNLAKSQSEIAIEERVFNDEIDGMVIYIDRASPKDPDMQGVFISDKRDQELSTTIIAKKAHLLSDPQSLTLNLRLFDGSIHRAGKDLESYQIGTFTTYDITLDLKASFSGLKRGKKKYREMTLRELREAVASRSTQGRELNELKIEYYKKYSIPFACFIFGLLGIPLGIRKMRGGKSYGFITSLIVILAYYLLLMTGETLGEKGSVSPFLGIFLPNILMGGLGIYLFMHAARETTPVSVIWMNRLLAGGRAFLMTLIARVKSPNH